MSEHNRRRENRVKVSWKAKVAVKGKGIESAQLRDISLSGVSFETRMKLAIGNSILLESVIEHSGDSQTFLIECEVMRQIPTDRPDILGYGTHITKLGKKNLSMLLPIIAELWVKQNKQ